MKSTKLWWALPVLLLWWGLAFSQDASPDRKKVRDPTAPTAKFRKSRGKLRKDFSAARLPKIVLRGRILSKGKEAAAFIEVDGSLVLVKKGSRLTLDGGSKIVERREDPKAKTGAKASARSVTTLENIVLEVLEITASDIRFQIQSTRQTLVVR